MIRLKLLETFLKTKFNIQSESNRDEAVENGSANGFDFDVPCIEQAIRTISKVGNSCRYGFIVDCVWMHWMTRTERREQWTLVSLDRSTDANMEFRRRHESCTPLYGFGSQITIVNSTGARNELNCAKKKKNRATITCLRRRNLFDRWTFHQHSFAFGFYLIAYGTESHQHNFLFSILIGAHISSEHRNLHAFHAKCHNISLAVNRRLFVHSMRTY